MWRHHNKFRLFLSIGIFSLSSEGWGHSAAQAAPCTGDLNGSGAVDTSDVQCAVLTALAVAAGATLPPLCVVGGWAAADVDCSTPFGASPAAKAVSLRDVQITLAMALGALTEEVDASFDGCPDACQAPCGDGMCDGALGETAANCSVDCGPSPTSCCAAHAAAGCDDSGVQGCVCAISDFCCEFSWDTSCVELAKEFCLTYCASPSCALDGTIACGDVVASSTAQGFSMHISEGCVAALPTGGPEALYAFTPSHSGSVRLALLAPVANAASLTVRTGDCTTTSPCEQSASGEVVFEAVAGETYYAIVDGPPSAAGPFTLSVECESDCDTSALCAGATCGHVDCGGLSLPCGAACPPNQQCVKGKCEVVPPPNCPAFGTCNTPQLTPGCQDGECCALVCTSDPFCCQIEWDSQCVVAAIAMCPTTCGNGSCEPALGENCESCKTDCPCGAGQGCANGSCSPCAPADFCGSAVCGIAECGNGIVQCGTCPNGGTCSKGECFAEGACEVSADLVCGETINANNANLPSNIHSYACYQPLSTAGEAAFRFEATQTENVQITLLPGSKPIFLMLLEGSCTGPACTKLSSTTLTFSAVAGKTYYVVLDGPASLAGPFALQTSCTSQCAFPAICANTECGFVQCAGTNFPCGVCAPGTSCKAGQCVSP